MLMEHFSPHSADRILEQELLQSSGVDMSSNYSTRIYLVRYKAAIP